MFGKLFNRATPSRASTVAAAAKPPVPPKAADDAAARAAARADGEHKLKAATGNDDALLALARETPLPEIRLAAVQALRGEAALKQAEREFRNHDKRLHRAAKQAYETLARQRETRTQASQLIEAAQALAKEALIPANRLVELDQAWRTLDAALLEETQKTAFATLQSELAALTRERSDRQRNLNRWSSDAAQTLAELQAACNAVADGSMDESELDTAMTAARTVLAGQPEAGNQTLGAQLQAAVQQAELVAMRRVLLAELQQADAKTATSDTASQRWQAMPPLAEPQLAKKLDARFEQWRHQRDDAARQARQTEQQQRARAKNETVQQRDAALSNRLQAAEDALAAGHLTEVARHLAAIHEAQGHAAPGAALLARIHALQAEYAHLKGWQNWGGERAREELLQEAEALGQLAADPETAAKLPLKQHAQEIERLRTRWKELDRLGSPSNQPLWRRFDTALKAAYLPVAAQQQKLMEAREENLRARNALLDTLESVHLPNGEQAGEPGQKPLPGWRAVAQALDHFHTEWRKLGPVEHTVPHKAKEALLARMTSSVARLAQPLQEVRHGAHSQRTAFITRAKSLAADAQGRDVVAKVRALQAEWQQHAKAQPLARNLENALWAEFKAATDAIFKQRDAAHSAHTAELKIHQTAREALIARLREIPADLPPAGIRRSVAEIAAQWRQVGEAPRNVAARLESEYRAAHDQALQNAEAGVQRIWHGACDSLLARLALCEEAEAAAKATDLAARWATQAAQSSPPAANLLPVTWDQSLQRRFSAAIEATAPANSTDSAAFDALLLQLEAALEIASPPAFQEARRDLKLQAMKRAMEGRQHAQPAGSGIDALTANALGQPHANDTQRERLRAILAALRTRGNARGQAERHERS